MRQFIKKSDKNIRRLKTAVGAALGAGTAVTIHSLWLARDLTCLVSYPLSGGFTGAMCGLGMCIDHKVTNAPVIATAMSTGALSGGLLGTALIPAAPMIGALNLMSSVITIPAFTTVGAVLARDGKLDKIFGGEKK